MTNRAFSVTWDYLCPFARNAHEHLMSGIEAGADWEVTFTPFCLMQAHVEEGNPPVWEQEPKARGLLALEAGVVVRDRFPEHFLAAHRALFAARHDQGRDIADPEVVRGALVEAGAPADKVLAHVDDGWPLETVRAEHERSVAEHHVFGIPTFIAGDQAVFVRLMTRPGGDGALARDTIERLMGLVIDHPELNEFKHTTVPR